MSCCILVLYIIILMTVEGLEQCCLNPLMEVPCYKQLWHCLSLNHEYKHARTDAQYDLTYTRRESQQKSMHIFTLKLFIHRTRTELFRMLFLLFQWKIIELFSITIDLV